MSKPGDVVSELQRIRYIMHDHANYDPSVDSWDDPILGEAIAATRWAEDEIKNLRRELAEAKRLLHAALDDEETANGYATGALTPETVSGMKAFLQPKGGAT